MNKIKSFYFDYIKPALFLGKGMSLIFYTLGLFFSLFKATSHSNLLFDSLFKIKLLIVGTVIQVGFSNGLLIIIGLTIIILLTDYLPIYVRINKHFIKLIKYCLKFLGWILLSFPIMYYSVQFKLANKQVLRNMYFYHPSFGDPQVLLYYVALGLYGIIVAYLLVYFYKEIRNIKNKRHMKEIIKNNPIPKTPSDKSIV